MTIITAPVELVTFTYGASIASAPRVISQSSKVFSQSENW